MMQHGSITVSLHGMVHRCNYGMAVLASSSIKSPKQATGYREGHVVINPLAAENCTSPLYALLPLLVTVMRSPVPNNRPRSQTTHAEQCAQPSNVLHAAKFSVSQHWQAASMATILLPKRRCPLPPAEPR
jgi:hypothetical protein